MFTDGRFDNELGAVLCASPSRAAMDFHTRGGSPDLRALYVPTASVSPPFGWRGARRVMSRDPPGGMLRWLSLR